MSAFCRWRGSRGGAFLGLPRPEQELNTTLLLVSILPSKALIAHKNQVNNLSPAFQQYEREFALSYSVLAVRVSLPLPLGPDPANSNSPDSQTSIFFKGKFRKNRIYLVALEGRRCEQQGQLCTSPYPLSEWLTFGPLPCPSLFGCSSAQESA